MTKLAYLTLASLASISVVVLMGMMSVIKTHKEPISEVFLLQRLYEECRNTVREPEADKKDFEAKCAEVRKLFGEFTAREVEKQQTKMLKDISDDLELLRNTPK